MSFVNSLIKDIQLKQYCHTDIFYYHHKSSEHTYFIMIIHVLNSINLGYY